MLGVIDKRKALSFVSSYYDLLAKTGYVKHTVTNWYLTYIFLIDFIGWVYPYMSNEDYKLVDTALVKMFSAGNCLVPYQVFYSDKLKIASHVGLTHYSGPSVLRKEHPVGIIRSTENNSFRRVE